jgi:mitochondrial fission protein ELM1
MEGDRADSDTQAVNVARTLDLVERVMQDVDSRSLTEIDTLLTDLLCAAWPTPLAQCQ